MSHIAIQAGEHVSAFQATYAGYWTDRGAPAADIVAGLLALCNSSEDHDRLAAEIVQFLADRRQLMLELGMAA